MKQKTRSWIIIILLFMFGNPLLLIGLLVNFVDEQIGVYMGLIGALCLIVSIISAIIMVFTIADKKCPQCGKKIPSNSKFCIECGEELKEKPNTKGENLPGKICSQCGSSNPSHSKFCLECGGELN